MDYPTFIGTRYIRSKKKRTISAITFIAVAGIALGVGALSAVLCISTGFQDEFTKKVLGVNAHILVMKYGMNFYEYPEVIKTIEQIEGVKSIQPFVIQEMMISKDDRSGGILLKGIEPNLAVDVLDLPKHIIKGSLDGLRLSLENNVGDSQNISLEDKKPANEQDKLPGIIIGKTLAENINAKVGDVVQVTTPLIGLDMLTRIADDDIPRFMKFEVAGIFYAGFLEYDTKLVFVNYRKAQKFFSKNDVVTGVELVVNQLNHASKIAKEIEKKVGPGMYRVVDWEELNKPLFTALKTQKLAFTVLLSIIVGVAAFNIIATLVMMVFDKRKEIAILKSMGASRFGIMRIFLHAGIVVGLMGISIGLLAGYLACYLLDKVGWPLDPEVYLIDHLPVSLEPFIFMSAAGVAFIICLVATAIPSLTASRFRPVDGLRED